MFLGCPTLCVLKKGTLRFEKGKGMLFLKTQPFRQIPASKLRGGVKGGFQPNRRYERGYNDFEPSGARVSAQPGPALCLD